MCAKTNVLIRIEQKRMSSGRNGPYMCISLFVKASMVLSSHIGTGCVCARRSETRGHDMNPFILSPYIDFVSTNKSGGTALLTTTYPLRTPVLIMHENAIIVSFKNCRKIPISNGVQSITFTAFTQINPPAFAREIQGCGSIRCK